MLRKLIRKSCSWMVLPLILCMIVSACGTKTAAPEAGTVDTELHTGKDADQEAREAEAREKSGTVGRIVLAKGEELSGFVVEELLEYQPAQAMIYSMIHEKTGAKVVWISNDDKELSFDISFRTTVDNDRGAPHVFEHACLGGSEKYPDSQLWESMSAGLYLNYLNAYTMPTYTAYQLSSLSENQLVAAMDMYLDGVFHPLLLKEPKIMQREAYHLELDQPDGEVTETGIVYSEMMARIEEDSVSRAFLHSTFPGSVWEKETGGHPDHIPELTNEELKEFHEKYYHPSNCLVTLYGDMDICRVLGMIDQDYFRGYEKKRVDYEDRGFQPVSGTITKELETVKSDSGEVEWSYYYTIPLRNITEEEQILMETLAGSALNRRGTILYERIQKEFPEGILDISVMDYAEPVIVFEITRLTQESRDAEAFRAAVTESIEKQLEEGLKKDLLQSLLRNYKKNQSLLRENRGIGISMSQKAADGFAHGDAMKEMRKEAKLLEYGEEWLEAGMLQKVMEEQLKDPETSVLLTIKRVPGTLEEWEREHAEAFQKRNEVMTQEDRKALIQATEEFYAWTKANNDPANSMLEQVRAVTSKELPELVKHYQAQETDVDGMRMISADYDSDLVGLLLYLDASAIPAEEIRALSAALSLLGELDTEEYSAEELDQRMTDYDFDLAYSAVLTSPEGMEYTPYVVLTALCYPDEVEQAFAMMESVLARTAFTDREYIRWLLGMIVNEGKENALSNPLGILGSMGNAAISPAHRFLYEKGSLPFLQYCEQLSKLPDDQLEQELRRMQELLDMLRNQNGMILGAAGRAGNLDKVKKAGKKLFDGFSQEKQEAQDYEKQLEPIPRSAVVLTGGSRNYNYEAVNYRSEGIPFSHRYPVFAELTRERVMIPQFRLNGGAYGAGSQIGKISAVMFTVRDAEVLGTYDQFKNVSSLLRQSDVDEDMIDSYIMSAYGDMGIPDTPLVGAGNAIEDQIRGVDRYAENEIRLRELKAFSRSDMEAYTEIWDVVATSPNRVRYSAGSVEDMKQAAYAFDEVISWYIR